MTLVGDDLNAHSGNLMEASLRFLSAVKAIEDKQAKQKQLPTQQPATSMVPSSSSSPPPPAARLMFAHHPLREEDDEELEEGDHGERELLGKEEEEEEDVPEVKHDEGEGKDVGVRGVVVEDDDLRMEDSEYV